MQKTNKVSVDLSPLKGLLTREEAEMKGGAEE